MQKTISKLQYITMETADTNHIQAVEEACIAACDWIQIRIKSKPEKEILEIAKQAKEICESFQVRLIMNDYVAIANEIRADGLHLGKNDMAPDKARKIVGSDCIIGGTANSWEDVRRLIDIGVDYIGLGPFRFTSTKENLSPILGLKGYANIVNQLSQHNFSIPIIAIGGIQVEDIPAIMETGVHGIAVSGVISRSTNKKETVTRMINALNNGSINYSK